MAIQKVPRDPEHLEMLRLYAAVDPVEAVGAGLRDTERLDEFLARARASLEHSIATPSRMHGLRAQALFRATLVALGQFRLLIDEDAGDPYYNDDIGRLAPPDFRVVDNAGETLLVEVKSVKLNGPLKPFGVRKSDVEAWRRWGELTGTPVSLALWWAIPGRWTLGEIGETPQPALGAGSLRRLNRGYLIFWVVLPHAVWADIGQRIQIGWGSHGIGGNHQRRAQCAPDGAHETLWRA